MPLSKSIDLLQSMTDQYMVRLRYQLHHPFLQRNNTMIPHTTQGLGALELGALKIVSQLNNNINCDVP